MNLPRAGEVINGGYNIPTHLIPDELIKMKQIWIDFLRKQGARGGCRDFGRPAEELASAQSASIITPLENLGVIRVAGDDATAFLNNLLTNDIKNLAKDSGQRNGLCSPKGRLLATFLIWREGTDLMLALSADLHSAILKNLSMYILRSKVRLTDACDERILIGVSGTEGAKALGALGPMPAEMLKVADFGPGRMLRLDGQRYLLAVDPAAAAGVWTTLAKTATPAGLDAWDWLEIQSGVPMVTAATQEEFVPQMVNFDLIGGVSFKKGCYPGQEIVARTHYLGKIKRRMYLAHVDGRLPAPGEHLYAPETGDQSCGRVVLSAHAPLGGNDLLAVIQSSCAEAGEVHLESPSGSELTIRPLPYPLDKLETTST